MRKETYLIVLTDLDEDVFEKALRHLIACWTSDCWIGRYWYEKPKKDTFDFNGVTLSVEIRSRVLDSKEISERRWEPELLVHGDRGTYSEEAFAKKKAEDLKSILKMVKEFEELKNILGTL